MRLLQATTLLALAATGLADTWAGFENLPEGFYAGTIEADGSTKVHAVSLSDTGAPVMAEDGISFAMVANPTSTPARDISNTLVGGGSVLGKRAKTSDCWGGNLDVQGMDQSLVQLRNLVRPGYFLNSLGMRYIGYNVRGVYVYICNRASTAVIEHYDNGDLDFANYWMDSDCGAYESGYFWWPGNTRRVYGKAYSGTPVCLP